MSMLFKSRTEAVIAGICCLCASIALAQQTQTGQTGANQSRDNASERSAAGQSDRSSSAQSGRASSQGLGQTAQSNVTTATGNQGREVEQYLTACLLADNQAEVELSQIAQQHAKSSEVKEFAQMMVRDHQKMIQQLQQLSGAQGSGGQSDRSSAAGIGSGRTDANSNSSGTQSSTNTASDATRGSGSTNRNGDTGRAASTSGTAGTSGTAAAGSTNATGARESSASSASPGGGTSVNSLGAGGAAAAQAESGSGAVHQLMQIDRQIVQRKTQATKEELQGKSGAEFDKCFVGTAINAHVHAMAALEVIGQQSQGQLAQVAQQARPTVQQHLEHAKQLMKSLEGEAANSTTASRRSDSKNER
jgi:predicted outer membrane protein